MTKSAFGTPVCWAGRWAFLSGAWNGTPPCAAVGIHHIHTEDSQALVPVFCEQHFGEVLELGLITNPYVSEEELERLKSHPG